MEINKNYKNILDKNQKIQIITVILFCAIAMIVTYISTVTFADEYFGDHKIFGDFEWEILYIVPISLIVSGTVWSLILKYRIHLMQKYSFSTKEINDVLGNRLNFEVSEFKQKFGSRKLKIIDGIPRKISHFTLLIASFFLITYIFDAEPHEISQFALSIQTINLILGLMSLKWENRFTRLYYGNPSRIRDGKFARLNLIIVKITSLFGYFTLAVLTSPFNLNKDEDNESNENRNRFITSLILFPLIFGDAMGEIVGSKFGRIKIPVIGIGEINYKTILGTFSVFLFSLLPILLSAYAFYKINKYTIYMSLIISGSSAFVELYAPRATDNYFIPVTNALWCILFDHLNWF